MNSEDAWFVRRGSGWCTSIRPAGIRGWLLTGLFAGMVEGLTLWLNRNDGDLWPVSLVAVPALTLLFVTACYRLSAPKDPS